MAEQSVRVTAKGDFTQLQRGLKQLQGDLRNVTGEIDRGARKGGFFDDSQIRALDFFGKRFKSTLQEMKDALQEHGHAYERLLTQVRQAQGTEKEAFDKEIKHREQMIDKIEEQIGTMEKLYRERQKEAESFPNKSTSGGKPSAKPDSGGGSDGGGGKSSSESGLISGLMGMGKLALGMAGIGGIAALAHQAYGLAQARAINSLDLSQRMRGSNGWSGSNTEQWDKASAVGRADRMGYSASDTWGFLDQYSRTAGGINGAQAGGLLKFGRGYGLGTSEVASMAGGNRALGGTDTPKAFADAIAGSVGESGMTPRIMEVMETNNALLERMNTTLKDGSAKQILAYQTTLDRVGLSKNMMQLTGAQGANLIGGMGGIYKPGNDSWKWTGIRALQQYDPKKYGKMGMFDLESSFEDGLMNNDNIPAMSKYIKSQAGGNKNLELRMFQKWMADGGSELSKRETKDLYNATDSLTVFSEDNMKKLRGESVDSGSKYDAERKGLAGQGYMDTDARFEHAMEQIGRPIVEAIYTIKEGVTTGVESIVTAIQESGSVVKFLEEHWKELATVAGVAIVATNVLKVVAAMGMLGKFGGAGSMGGWLGRFGIPIAAAALGTVAIVKGYEAADKYVSDGGQKQDDVARQRYEAMHQADAPSWVTKPDQLDPSSKSYYRNDPRWAQSSEYAGMSEIEKKRKLMLDAGGTPVTDEKLKGMQKYLKELKESGDTHLQKLQTDSGKKMTSMEVHTKNAMESMDKKSVSGWDRLIALHKGVTDTVNNLFGLGAKTEANAPADTATASQTGSGYDARTSGSGVTAQSLNAKLGGVLGGKGQDFINAGRRSGIDPAVLAAIAMHETGNGTSPAAKNKNNVGGMMSRNGSGLMSFGSVTEGIDSMASNLQRNYTSKGITSIEQIQKKYAPVGAGNDPTDLNSNWTKGVYSYLSRLGINTGKKSTSLMKPEDMLAGILSAGSNRTITSKSEISVKFDVTGKGADALNKFTTNQLESLVRKMLTEIERNKLSMNPTKLGAG